MSSKFLSEKEFFFYLEKNIPGECKEFQEIVKNARVYLTRMDISGAEEMHEYSADAKFYNFLEYEPFKNIEETKAYINRLLILEKNILGRSCISWFVRDLESKKIIGTCRFINIDFRRQSISWGYGLSSNFWGQGYVLEIQRILLDFVFNRLGFNRLYGVAQINNKPTISSLLSIGMKEEGVHPDAMRSYDGTYHDSWSYGMLKKDYPKSRIYIPENIFNLKKYSYSNNRLIFNNKKLEKVIRQFLYEYKNIELEKEFKDLPFWDSFKHMELIANIEKELKITITPDEILKIKSIKSILILYATK